MTDRGARWGALSFGFVVGLSAEARLLRHVGASVEIGGGFPPGAKAAAERLIATGVRGVVSFGLAGGLKPGLQPGALLVPQAVLDGGEAFACDPELIETLGGACGGVILASDRIAETAQHKAALFAETSADAVDLESGAVARVAAAHQLPFAVLRAVTDPAERNLPPAAMIALNSAGRIQLRVILASVARTPGQIPELLAIARDARKARAALVGRVRNVIGPFFEEKEPKGFS